MNVKNQKSICFELLIFLCIFALKFVKNGKTYIGLYIFQKEIKI